MIAAKRNVTTWLGPAALPGWQTMLGAASGGIATDEIVVAAACTANLRQGDAWRLSAYPAAVCLTSHRPTGFNNYGRRR